MAKKRMFNLSVVDSDAFLDMPMSAQALYFHLNMRADDDGFIANAKRIQRYVGASDDDMRILIAKRFLLNFNNGLIVVTHWRIHNTLQSDRYTPTEYLDERNQLYIKENKSYSFDEGVPVAEVTDKRSKRIVVNAITECNKNVSSLETNMETNFIEMETNVETKMETFCEQSDSTDKNRLGIGIDIVECVNESNIDNINNISDEQNKDTEHTHTPKSPEEQYYDSLCSKYGKEFVDIRVKRGRGYNGITWSKIGKWCEMDYKREHNSSRASPSTNQFNQGQKTDYDVGKLEEALLNN